MDTKFTKGPLTVKAINYGDGDDYIYVDDASGRTIIDPELGLGEGSDPEALANAHLYAASPDMFIALTMAEMKIAGLYIEKSAADQDAVLISIRAALAKARGEPC